MLFRLVGERHFHRRPMMFTTNQLVEEWGRALHDADLAAVSLVRVLQGF
ncbi:MAG: hypothetical protein ACREB9_03705 [Thermoplasmata archaeon]